MPTKTQSCDPDSFRLLARVARMYHERGIRQPEIAANLRISQSSVSRLLRQASDIGIVRTVVSLPSGVYTDLEDELERRYGLLDSVVVDTDGTPGDPGRTLGASAAAYLRETLDNGDVVGLPACSPILLATVEAMRPKIGLEVKLVTQISEGNGDPRSQIATARLIDRLANVTGAKPILLPGPSLSNNRTTRRALLGEPAVSRAQDSWRQLSVALLDINRVQPHATQPHPDDVGDPGHDVDLAALGAVGRICVCYFDEQGEPINSHLNERLLSIPADRLKAVPRRIGIVTKPGTKTAIVAAITGGWVNTLITDLGTARRLVDD